MRFYKYQALGNDYIVIEPQDGLLNLTPSRIKVICHRNYGIGSDGILFGPLKVDNADFGLKIFNPDGSEAEKSGNGIRIFTRFLWDTGRISYDGKTVSPVTIHTLGGIVKSVLNAQNGNITCDMGRVSFDSRKIPVTGPAREVLNEKMVAAGKTFTFSAATVGNPHCVIIQESISASEAKRLGPLIENMSIFPHRTNVQFMQVIDRQNIRLEIWERGAGYTLASGTSSSAAAAVAHKLGFCDSAITVHSPGGALQVTVADDVSISICGPAVKIAEGLLCPEIFTADPANSG